MIAAGAIISENDRSVLLNEAIRIGDMLLAKAEPVGNMLTWKTVVISGRMGTADLKNVKNVYNGTTGIIVFFLNLYRVTKDKAYLDAAERGMEWVMQTDSEKEQYNYALYTGQLFNALCLLSLWEITGKEHYHYRAISIAKGARHFVHYPTYDLINGIGGTLLGLIHIHEATGDQSLLKVIDEYTRVLISKLSIGANGIFWDRAPTFIKGLCGFSHGCSGLAFVFMELGQYFGNPAFFEVARQCIRYEDQFFIASAENWLDLRLHKDPVRNQVEFSNAYQEGNIRFYSTPTMMNAWCHGSAGIGLTRLRAYELLNEPEKMLTEINTCLRKTFKTDALGEAVFSHCLCHGSAGNGMLFVEAYETLQRPDDLDMGLKVARQMMSGRRKDNSYRSGNPGGVEDTSLFMGIAGVGHFLLRLLHPDLVPSVLYLKTKGRYADFSKSEYPTLSMSRGEIHKAILRSAFRRTLDICENLFPNELGQYMDNLKDIRSYRTALNDFVDTLPEPARERLNEALTMELQILDWDLSTDSYGLVDFKNTKKKEDMKRLLSKGFPLDDEAFVTDSDLTIVSTRWPLSDDDADQKFYAVTRGVLGVNARKVSQFSKIILDQFREAGTVSGAIARIAQQFDDDDNERLAKMIVEQIREMIAAGYLIAASKHPVNGVQQQMIENKRTL